MIKQIKGILENYQPLPLGIEKEYAVLLPLIWLNDSWHVLYEVRSQHISQPGEVSFPGGRVEAGENYSQAAIRETIEELQVSEDQIEVMGEIDYIIQSKRSIHCFVGQIKVSQLEDIRPNEEVDRLFTVPLESLMKVEPVYYDLTSHVTKDINFPFEKIRNGKKYPFSHQRSSIPFYETFEHTIWGLTAQFTNRFISIIKEQKD